ncbi:hypothetical protein V5097_13340 [Arenibacter palladensis]|uniref:hypothetical protein n=1 Tax=Arenibacter palladensis TaxID=237373 RepID=UPI002FD21CEC
MRKAFKLFIPIILIITVITTILNCKTEEKKPVENIKNEDSQKIEPNSTNLNVSLLLDLSDRINPTKYPNNAMEFFQRDVGYIKSVSEVFLEHLSAKKVRQANEKIELFFEPSPSNPEINTLSNKLKYPIIKDNLSLDLLNDIENTYSKNPIEIYELAIKDDNYVGSDTWRFFKNKVSDYCLQEGHRNILVILTDGYIYHKDTQLKEGNRSSYLTPQEIRKNKLNSSNWGEKMVNEDYGFVKIDVDLSDLEILVLGINPDPKNVYEEDVIYEYWGKWFKEMNVKRFAIKQADLPSNMDKIIREFILDPV